VKRWGSGICTVILGLGALLSVAATGNDFWLHISVGGETAFLHACCSSLPATVALSTALFMRGPRRQLGFKVGIFGALAGIAATAYQTTFLVLVESGYVFYGMVLIASLLGLRLLSRQDGATPVDALGSAGLP